MSKKWLCGFIELAVVLAKPIMRFVSLSHSVSFQRGWGGGGGGSVLVFVDIYIYVPIKIVI